jgi:ribose transport system ATP-binding protein
VYKPGTRPRPPLVGLAGASLAISAPEILSAQGIVKHFGATAALCGANVALRRGEVHALLGENGAGKSTLVKILVGALQPDAGEIQLAGDPLRLSSVRDAVKLGIIPVYQHLTLMPHLSVRENLFAFELAEGAFFRGLPRSATAERARSMLGHVGLTIDPDTPVERLPLAQRQLVEIARGISRQCRALVLDEPTATLNRVEVERLFAAIRTVCSGGASVLFISHKIDEVQKIADRISVLRDGQSVIEGAPCRALSTAAVIEAMVGRSFEATKKRRPEPRKIVLRAQALSLRNRFHDVSLAVRQREILGVVGLVGSGALELGAALAGASSELRGQLDVNGRAFPHNNRVAAHSMRIGLIPADREQEGVFRGLSIVENASASILGALSPAGWLSRRREAQHVRVWVERLSVVPADLDIAIERLSGGNQQKVIVIRNLMIAGMTLLVALEPTRGVDIAARDEIHNAIVDAAEQGAAVIVASSDLDEVVALSHRILVMRGGRMVGELPADSEPSLLLARLTGAAP